MGNLCATGGAVFLSKQHRRGPSSANLIKLNRKQNVHIVEGDNPDNPAKKSFQKIVTTLQQHLSPKPLEIAERFRFNKRNRREG